MLFSATQSTKIHNGKHICKADQAFQCFVHIPNCFMTKSRLLGQISEIVVSYKVIQSIKESDTKRNYRWELGTSKKGQIETYDG